MIKVNLSDSDNIFNQVEDSLKIISEIDKTFDKREKIELDLSEVKWVLPCSVILISGKLMEILNKGAEVSYISPKDLKAKEWLSNIGFPLGKKLDGDTFISIKHFQHNPQNMNQVNEQANEVLKKIESRIPNSFGDSIKYILGELVANIDDHSNFTFASLMVQYYPKKEHLDLVVLDNGITIPLNFEKNDIAFKKDSEAIKKALYGEVTTKKDEGTRGYGLKSCRDISLNGIKGELHILSRKGLIILKEQDKPQFHDFEDVSLEGTFLYFRLPTPKKKINIKPYLEG